MTRKPYDTDLTDQEWAQLEPYFSNHRTYKWSKRELVNATLYITKTGCQWRMLPHDFPPYPTVWSFFRRAKESGLWDTILTELVKKSDWKLVNQSLQLMPSLILKVWKQRMLQRIVALMVVKKSRGESATSLLIRWAIFLMLWFMLRISMTPNQGF